MASPVVSHPRCPDRRERLPISPGFWHCRLGKRVSYCCLWVSQKVDIRLLLLGSSWAQGTEASAHSTLLVRFLTGVRCGSCRCYLLLFWVLCLREKGQFLTERRKPASLAFFLSRHHFIPTAILFISDINSGVADVHCWSILPSDSTTVYGIWVRWTLKILQNVHKKDLLNAAVPRTWKQCFNCYCSS